MRGLFITGTDTGVGKTFVTAWMARELAAQGVPVGAYKPACSGAETAADGSAVWPDVAALSAALTHGFPSERICPQRFRAPLAPPVAARQEGGEVDAALLRAGAAWWEDRVEVLLVEGVGGLLCPLTDHETVADLAGDLGFPLLIVARLGLGTINHTLLTIEAARSRGLAVAGVLLNECEPAADDPAAASNPGELVPRCPVPVLGVLRHGGTGGLLHSGQPTKMDWSSLATPPRRR